MIQSRDAEIGSALLEALLSCAILLVIVGAASEAIRRILAEKVFLQNRLEVLAAAEEISIALRSAVQHGEPPESLLGRAVFCARGISQAGYSTQRCTIDEAIPLPRRLEGIFQLDTWRRTDDALSE